jgi:hypothetical protein
VVSLFTHMHGLFDFLKNGGRAEVCTHTYVRLAFTGVQRSLDAVCISIRSWSWS